MTEIDWLECVNHEVMLAYLGERASARKKRLFASACVRRLWPFLDEKLRLAVRIAERHADGRLSEQHMQQAQKLVRRLREQREEAEKARASWKARAERAAAHAVEALLPVAGPRLQQPRDIREPPDVVSATRTARTAYRAVEAQREQTTPSPDPATDSIRRLEALDACDLVREVFGNPFHPVAFEPCWRTWKDNTVERMARMIYQKRSFRNLPVLADALEQSSCKDAEILTHCRAPMEHVRGCWVVDGVLGLT